MTEEQRFPGLPQVPTIAESGVPGYAVAGWNGLAVPSHTPREVVLRLSREIQAIMEMPDVKKRLSDLNLTAQSSTPEQVAEVLAADIKRWHEVITKAKIEKQ